MERCYAIFVLFNLLSLFCLINGAILKRSSADSHQGGGYIYRSDSGSPTQLIYLGGRTGNPYYSLAASTPTHYSKFMDNSPQFHKILHHMHSDDQFQPVPKYLDYVKHYEASPLPSQTYQHPLYPTLHPYILFNAHQKMQDDSEKLNKYTAKVQHDHEASKHGHEEVDGTEEKKENYSKEDGSSKNFDQHSAKGEKFSKGYKSDNTYEKGDSGKHDKDEHSSNYDEEGGHKKENYESDSDHKEHHAEGHKTEGGEHDSKKYHKKGSKTTGYHNVYHKDEYKKDHTFYDTADHSGSFKKYGSEHKKHHSKAGDSKKQGHHESAYDEGHKHKKGSHEKGHYDKADEGHLKKHGHQEQHKTGEEYSKKDYSSGENEHGHQGHY